jgi:site-specific DNA-methyltransferase (adenine-specific)
MKIMQQMKDNSVDFTLTDIPYDAVNRNSNGLRSLDKQGADIMVFDLIHFLLEVTRVTKNSICIFCGKEQFSGIFEYFANQPGTVRPIIWEKSNPSPMNGQYIYLSGVEFAVWFKKKGAKVFNAHCKNTVFKFPNGKREIHPTQKNINLFKQLIIENTNINDVVFDPCSGSATTLVAAKQLNRRSIGCELDSDYFAKANKRISETANECEFNQITLDRPDYARP